MIDKSVLIDQKNINWSKNVLIDQKSINWSKNEKCLQSLANKMSKMLMPNV